MKQKTLKQFIIFCSLFIIAINLVSSMNVDLNYDSNWDFNTYNNITIKAYENDNYYNITNINPILTENITMKIKIFKTINNTYQGTFFLPSQNISSLNMTLDITVLNKTYQKNINVTLEDGRSELKREYDYLIKWISKNYIILLIIASFCFFAVIVWILNIIVN